MITVRFISTSSHSLKMKLRWKNSGYMIKEECFLCYDGTKSFFIQSNNNICNQIIAYAHHLRINTCITDWLVWVALPLTRPLQAFFCQLLHCNKQQMSQDEWYATWLCIPIANCHQLDRITRYSVLQHSFVCIEAHRSYWPIASGDGFALFNHSAENSMTSNLCLYPVSLCLLCFSILSEVSMTRSGNPSTSYSSCPQKRPAATVCNNQKVIVTGSVIKKKNTKATESTQKKSDWKINVAAHLPPHLHQPHKTLAKKKNGNSIYNNRNCHPERPVDEFTWPNST